MIAINSLMKTLTGLEEPLQALMDKGVTLEEIWEVFRYVDRDYEKVLTRLLTNLELLEYGEDLGFALMRHSDEVVTHPHYKEFLWDSSNPEVIIEFIDKGFDRRFLEIYKDSYVLEIYLRECEKRDETPGGDKHTLFSAINYYYDGHEEAIQLMYYMFDMGWEREVIDDMFLGAQSYDEAYLQYVNTAYNTEILESDAKALVILEALLYRGYSEGQAIELAEILRHLGYTVVGVLVNEEYLDEYINLAGDSLCEVLMGLSGGDIPDNFLGKGVIWNRARKL